MTEVKKRNPHTPINRKYGEFVGGRTDENDNPVGNDYKLVN